LHRSEVFSRQKDNRNFSATFVQRTRDFASEFAEALSGLDELLLLDIYPARELPIPGVTSEIILKEVKLADKNIYSKETLFPNSKNAILMLWLLLVPAILTDLYLSSETNSASNIRQLQKKKRKNIWKQLQNNG
jgi:hypothetical protein